MITHSVVEHFMISDLPNLDPINVYLEDFAPGKGQIVITCWDAAWLGIWFGMGTGNIRQFVSRSGTDYLVGKMYAQNHKRTKAHEKYLTRIMEAVKTALKESQRATTQGTPEGAK